MAVNNKVRNINLTGKKEEENTKLAGNSNNTNNTNNTNHTNRM